MLPAYAGMIPDLGEEKAELNSAPRVCGDDPITRLSGLAAIGCSPRMRG